MRKAAFFDIDGTVMDVPDGMHQPSSAVIQALHQFQNEGNEIFLATSGGTSLIDGEKIRCNGPIGNDGHYITSYINMYSEMVPMLLKCFVWSDMALPWEMQLSS